MTIADDDKVMDDLISINKELTYNILELKKAMKQLMIRAQDKANAQGAYEKKVAQIMLQMRETGEYEGNRYNTATGLEKVAKGLAFKESIAFTLAEDKLRNLQYAMNAYQTIINALQSKLKYLDNE